MLLRLILIPAIILAIYCLFDLSSSDTNRRVGLSPIVWTLIIILIPILGPIAWLIISRMQGKAARDNYRTGYPAANRNTKQPGGQVAPDDDPDFLWRLAQQQRREKAARDKAKSEEQPPSSENDQDETDPTDDTKTE